LWGFSLFNARYSGNLRQGYEGEKNGKQRTEGQRKHQEGAEALSQGEAFTEAREKVQEGLVF